MNVRSENTVRWLRAALFTAALLALLSTIASAQSISGTVFEDQTYSGGSGRSKAASGGVGIAGVRVELYDSTGNALGWTTTATGGTYTFTNSLVARNRTYYVRVVNTGANGVSSARTGGNSVEVGVQTYRTTFANSTATGDGESVGGTKPSVADGGDNSGGGRLSTTTWAITGLGQAQSVASVVVPNINGYAVTGIDFGFNFDTIVNVNDSGQGSLRQFIINANTLSGADTSIFMISDGGTHPGISGDPSLLTGGIAVISLSTALPTLTDANTTLDATTQGTNVANNNSALLGTGGTVGTAAVTLDKFPGPEAELAGASADLSLAATGTGITIQGFALHRVGISVSGANSVVQWNVIGMHANGSIGSTLTLQGITIGAGNNIRVLHNYVKTNNSAIRRDGNGSGAVIQYNEVDLPVSSQTDTFDGILLIGPGTASNDTIQYNLVKNLRGGGIELGFSGTLTVSNCLIDNNSTIGNGVLSGAASTEPLNLAFYLVTSSSITVSHNVITNAGGVGILVRQATGVKMSQNSMHTNGLATSGGSGPGIQLDPNTGDPNTYGTAPGPAGNNGAKTTTVGNNGMDYPIITLAGLNSATGQLRLKGYVGSAAGQTAFANSTIEIFRADNSPANQNGPIIAADGKSVAHGEGTTYVATITADASGNFDVVLTGTGLAANDVITATATDTSSNTSEFAANVTVVAVTNVSGNLYADVNHDGTNTGEDWSTGPASATYINLVQSGAVVASTPVVGGSAGAGAYTIVGVPSGTYSLVVTNSATSTTVAYPTGWIPVSPANGTLAVTVAATPVAITGQNFGLFNGSKLSGSVFVDTGTGGGTANNGTQDGTEAGYNGATITATYGASGTATTTTSATGAFTMWLSGSAANLVVTRAAITGYTGVAGAGGTSGTVNGVYTRGGTTDSVAVGGAGGLPAGNTFANMRFGIVPVNVLTNTGAQSTNPSATLYYAHTFTAGSAGTLTLSTAAVQTPTQSGWTQAIYQDADCSGTFTAGDTVVTTGQTFTFPNASATPYQMCVLVRDNVPAAASGNEVITVTASYTYSTAGVTDAKTQTDTTTIAFGISGYAYSDVNHDATRAATGEAGTGVALFAKLLSSTNTLIGSPVAIDSTTGAYTLPMQPPGTYKVILSTNNTPTDLAPTSPSGWVATENAAASVTLTISTTNQAAVNFGLFRGSKVSGSVFVDNGAGSGTANNGVQDGTEAAIAAATVSATDVAGTTTYDTTTTSAAGTFTLWVPGTPTTVVIRKAATVAYPVAVNGNAGTTAGTYSSSAETVTFTNAVGTTYTGIAFGDVAANTLSNTGSQSLVPTASFYYPHVFVANSTGTLVVTKTVSVNPAQTAWSETVYRDVDCNGSYSAATDTVYTGAAISLTQTQSACFLVKETVPAGATGTNTVTLSAAFTYTGSQGPVVATLTRTDTTSTGAPPNLTLVKTSDKQKVYPGDVVTYTITYTNNGSFPASNIQLSDTVPQYTTFVAAACGSLPSGITNCTIASPAVGATGSVGWTLIGTLPANGSGSLTLQVKVQ